VVTEGVKNCDEGYSCYEAENCYEHCATILMEPTFQKRVAQAVEIVKVGKYPPPAPPQ
jgi:hypothetical protein